MKTMVSALLVSLALTGAVVPASAAPRDGVRLERRSDDTNQDERRGHADRSGGARFDDVLSERRIARLVRRGGFAAIEDIRLQRDRYVVMAVRPNGAVFRLALDAHDGDVIGSERIGWSRGYDRRDYDRFRDSGHYRSGGFPLGLGG